MQCQGFVVTSTVPKNQQPLTVINYDVIQEELTNSGLSKTALVMSVTET